MVHRHCLIHPKCGSASPISETVTSAAQRSRSGLKVQRFLEPNNGTDSSGGGDGIPSSRFLLTVVLITVTPALDSIIGLV